MGTPAAAAWFVAHNYRAVGNSSAAKQWLVVGTLATVALLLVSPFLPESLPNSALPIGYTIGIVQAVRLAHGDALARHLEAGGKKGSWWKVVGISALYLLAITAAVVVYVLMEGGSETASAV